MTPWSHVCLNSYTPIRDAGSSYFFNIWAEKRRRRVTDSIGTTWKCHIRRPVIGRNSSKTVTSWCHESVTSLPLIRDVNIMRTRTEILRRPLPPNGKARLTPRRYIFHLFLHIFRLFLSKSSFRNPTEISKPPECLYKKCGGGGSKFLQVSEHNYVWTEA